MKRVRTRALLMDSAITQFAHRGIEKTSIDDICARADVSHGTFYYHFADKDDIVDTVGHAVAAGLVNLVDREIRDISSGAERVAMATQVFLAHAAESKDWGWLVVHALADMGSFFEQISRGIRKDVLIGIRNGEFSANPDPLLFASLLAVVSAALRARLEKPGEPGIEQHATVLLLRMLGVPPGDADNLPEQVIARYGDRAARPKDDMKDLLPLLLKEVVTRQEDRSAR